MVIKKLVNTPKDIIDKKNSQKINFNNTHNIKTTNLKRNQKKRKNDKNSTENRTAKRSKIISDYKLLYSPTNTNSIEILQSDLKCLTPGKYLNDNIINFYLIYIYHEILTKEQRKAAYFFNVFFNTKLIGTEEQQKIDTTVSRHARVAKWTKNVDIFSKDFIVIPVVEDEHWFLVIVCFPWMAGKFDYDKLFEKNKENNELDYLETRVSPMPCILMLDSLSFKNKKEKLNIIREYLNSEWASKREAKYGPMVFDKTTVRGYSPVIPSQRNTTDCGLFLLHYVELFYKKPITDFHRDFFTNCLRDWFDITEIREKRKHIKNIILEKTTRTVSEDDDSDGEGVNSSDVL